MLFNNDAAFLIDFHSQVSDPLFAQTTLAHINISTHNTFSKNSRTALYLNDLINVL